MSDTSDASVESSAPEDMALADLVSRDWRGLATAEQVAFLHDHPEEWVDALKAAIGDILAQLTQRRDREAEIRSDLSLSYELQREMLAEYADWRRRAAGAKGLMERRLLIAKRLAGKQRDARVNGEDHEMRYLYYRAIKAHREAVTASEFAPTEADIELWTTLEEWPERKAQA